MSTRLLVAFVLVFAFACLLLPGRAFATAALTITKSHTGNFTVGTNGTYTLTVTNTGADTTAAITVMDMLPAGLTFITGTGTGWSCSASAQTVTCTKPSLAGGSSSSITLTVSVGVAAVPSVTNTATVSGGGTGATGGTSNSDATTVNMTVKSGPAVYISTFTGQQILVVDGAVGTTVPIHTATTAFSPEDIVVGPDKKIYICDSLNSKVWRVRQDDTQVEIVYDHSTATAPNNPTGPEGPSFQANDLYFNTRDGGGGGHTGVWKIAGVASIAFGETFPAPSQVFNQAATGSTFGEGTAFDKSANLYVVDSSGSRVLKSSPPYSSLGLFIPRQVCVGDSCTTNLATPVGIAVNSGGDIFAANAGFSLKNINHFNSTSTLVETYASFSGSDLPIYLEFDALDRLYVVTADAFGAGGKVWRIDPPGGQTNLVFLVALSTSITGVTSDKAVGVGVAPNAAITKTYSAGSAVGNTFDFTTDQVKITFPGVSTAFDLTVFREEVPQALLALQLATNLAGIPCFEYDSDRGTCVVYEEGVGSKLDPLLSGFTGPVDYQLIYTTPTGATTGKPVLAHARDDMLQAPVDQYDEDELKGFTLATSVGSDPDGMDGSSNGGISRHVALNTPLLPTATGTTFCPLPPVATDGLTFNKPQTIAIKFQIAAPGGTCAAGPFVTSPVPNSQLWLFNTDTSTFITPTASGSSSIPNAFHFDPTTGVSIFNLSTKDLFAPPAPATATYIFTITSDSVSAHVSNFRLTQ